MFTIRPSPIFNETFPLFFLLFIEPELKRNEVQRAPAPTKPDMRPITSIECLAGPGEFHNHQVPPRDLVEYATIRWGCRLRVILHHAEETNMQSVEFVVSSWSHKLSVSLQSIKNRLSNTLKRYRRRVETGDPRATLFLSRHGEDQFASFRQFIIEPHPYWSAPKLVGLTGNSLFKMHFKSYS